MASNSVTPHLVWSLTLAGLWKLRQDGESRAGGRMEWIGLGGWVGGYGCV